MALASKHPLYGRRLHEWNLMRDSVEGQHEIKKQRTLYLPATDMMVRRGLFVNNTEGTSTFNNRSLGWKMYDAYLKRAVYHDIVRPALDAMLGVMHKKPAQIEVPPQLEPLLERASFVGDDIQTLLQKINREQIVKGRVGCLLDVPKTNTVADLPYIVTYATESIGNWDASKVYEDSGPRSLQFVVLDESGYQRQANALEWTSTIRFRVLGLASTLHGTFGDLSAFGDNYIAAETTQENQENVTASQFIAPSLGPVTLKSIPFVFIGPRDLVPEPDRPPLLPLAEIALAIYRGEADYRQALFLQGQQTLVTVGQVQSPAADLQGQEATEVGAGAEINLNLGGDAFYIGASADGLGALADAIKEDKRQAAHLGANLLEKQGGAAESGDALLIRTEARTSSLTTIATTGAAGLKQILRDAAIWVGADPDKVIVEPNLDFSTAEAAALDLLNIMNARMLGLPMSDETTHWWMGQKGFTNKTFDEEKQAMEGDGPIGLASTGNAPIPGINDPAAAKPAPAKGDTGNNSRGSPGTSKGGGTGGKGKSRGTGGSKKRAGAV